MVMFKILVKSLKNPFRIFKLLKYLQRKYYPKIPRKFYHVTYDILGDLAKSHDLENKITSSNPLKTISVNFEV